MQKNINCILMRTVAVLLMLVLVSTSIVTGRFARYVSTASYSDSARVAKFNIVTSADSRSTTEIQAKLVPGDNVEGIVVKNFSEVAVDFTLTVDNVSDNLPLVFSVKDGDTSITSTENSDGSITFTSTVAPNRTEKFLTLYIKWPFDENNIDLCGRVDLIRITLDAVQAD